MRVEDARTEERPGGTERSVRLSWIGGETRLWVRVPHGLAPAPDDLTAFVPVALLLAMRRSEPLQIDGKVSPRLLGRLPVAQEVLSHWDPTYARIPVRAAGRAAPAEPAAGRACCFSRGVDSMYSAAAPRPADRRFTHLVFCDTLEPNFGEETCRQEVVAARDAAHRVGTELVVVSTNVRDVLHDVIDYEDAYGAVLAMLGLLLQGCIGRLTIPANVDYGQLIPVGSHPLLDPLWSSEAVEVEHDSCALGRPGKVRWLVDQRPDLLPLLHVCFMEDSTRNCGRCSKCLLTMVLLQAAGGLERAGSFPPRIDLEALRRGRWSSLIVRLYLNGVYWAIPADPEHRDLRETIEHVLERSAGAPDGPGPYGISLHQTRLFRALEAGRPFPTHADRGRAPVAEVAELDPSWPPPRDAPPGLLGLAVGVDTVARRHAYAVDGVPPGSFAGELGAVLADPPPDGVPLRLDGAAGPVLPRPRNGRRAGLAAIRWTLAPIGWRGTSPRARARSAGRRVLDAARRAGRRNGDASSQRVAAWLHGRPGPGRLPLYAARHPVLDDVLLSTEAETARSLRYGDPQLIGYLEARAPLTGSLGVHRGALPWAHRWGRVGGR